MLRVFLACICVSSFFRLRLFLPFSATTLCVSQIQPSSCSRSCFYSCSPRFTTRLSICLCMFHVRVILSILPLYIYIYINAYPRDNFRSCSLSRSLKLSLPFPPSRCFSISSHLFHSHYALIFLTNTSLYANYFTANI